MGLKLFRQMELFLSGLLKENTFARNLFLSFSGNAVSMILGFCMTPFIAKVYGPEVYGIFALFIALITTLSPLSTLQFPSGFVATSSKREFRHLVVITFAVIVTGTILLTFFILLFSWLFV